jgi:hypothetical protein
MTQADLIADVLAELRGQLSGQTYYWPADQEELVKAAMARLKDIPPEAAVEFTLTSLRIVRDEHQGWPGHLLNKILGNVLRRNLTFTEDQVVELIELASVPHREFPYRGILKAAESTAVTPRSACPHRYPLKRPSSQYLTRSAGRVVAESISRDIDLVTSKRVGAHFPSRR